MHIEYRLTAHEKKNVKRSHSSHILFNFSVFGLLPTSFFHFFASIVRALFCAFCLFLHSTLISHLIISEFICCVVKCSKFHLNPFQRHEHERSRKQRVKSRVEFRRNSEFLCAILLTHESPWNHSTTHNFTFEESSNHLQWALHVAIKHQRCWWQRRMGEVNPHSERRRVEEIFECYTNRRRRRGTTWNMNKARSNIKLRNNDFSSCKNYIANDREKGEGMRENRKSSWARGEIVCSVQFHDTVTNMDGARRSTSFTT